MCHDGRLWLLAVVVEMVMVRGEGGGQPVVASPGAGVSVGAVSRSVARDSVVRVRGSRAGGEALLHSAIAAAQQ